MDSDSGYDSDGSNELRNPERLKTLACNVKDSEGNSLLHQFVLDNSHPNNSGSENYMKAVLKAMSEIAVDALNNEGYSAIHLAVLKNNLLMVQKLLSVFVKIRCNIYDFRSGYNTPLHLAVKLGNLSIIQELLNKGADVDIKNIDNRTALSLAAESGNSKAVKVLLSSEADLIESRARVNVPDIDGFTPLHAAVHKGHIQIIKALLEYGADMDAKSKDGKSPLDLAKEDRNQLCIEALQN